MTRITNFLIVLFVGYSSQATLTNNKDLKRNNEKGESGCHGQLKCTLISNCDSTVVYETIFPCKSEDGGEIFVCCHENVKNSTVIPVTTTTEKITTTTTRKPTNKWSGLSKSLQAKAKLLPDSCGVPAIFKDKIVNGKDTEMGEYPWMVLLGYKSDVDTNFNCGGSLINDRYVLTAAHCLRPLYLGHIVELNIARFGEWNMSSDVDCIKYGPLENETYCSDDVVDISIDRLIPHPQYGNESLPSFQNDIALIRTSKKVPFSEFIIPICLEPIKYHDFFASYYISGWGVSVNIDEATPVLQAATIKLYDFGECNAIAPPEFRPLSESQFCAGGESSNSCHGDSGGPLAYVTNGGTYFLKGIISLTTSVDCGESGRPNIYTEVVSFIPWILKTITK